MTQQPPFPPPPGQPYIRPVPKPTLMERFRNSTTAHVALTCLAGAVAAYWGTTKAVRGHTIEVYFDIAEQLEEIEKKAKKKHKKH